MFNINSGISAGPIWNQQRVGQATQQLGQPGSQLPTMPVGTHPYPGLQSALGEQLGGFVQQGGQQNALNFGRNAALGNAQHLLQSQQARAGSGVNWANLLSNQYGTDLQTRLMGNNALMNMLMGFF